MKGSFSDNDPQTFTFRDLHQITSSSDHFCWVGSPLKPLLHQRHASGRWSCESRSNPSTDVKDRNANLRSFLGASMFSTDEHGWTARPLDLKLRSLVFLQKCRIVPHVLRTALSANLQPATEGRPNEKIPHPSASVRPRLQVTNIAARVAGPHETSLTSVNSQGYGPNLSRVPRNYDQPLISAKHSPDTYNSRWCTENTGSITKMFPEHRFIEICCFAVSSRKDVLWYLWHSLASVLHLWWCLCSSVTVKNGWLLYFAELWSITDHNKRMTNKTSWLPQTSLLPYHPVSHNGIHPDVQTRGFKQFWSEDIAWGIDMTTNQAIVTPVAK